jgi:hypothetical protein
VDVALAPRAHKCGTRAIDTAIADATDSEVQAKTEALDKSHWQVRLFHGPMTGPDRWAGTSILQITGDTGDLTHLYDQICSEAGQIDTDDPVEVRQAIAVGVLARRMNGGRPPRIKLYLHAQLTDLTDLSDPTIGVGSVERLGPLTLGRIKDWAAHSAVTILPVLRMDRTDAVDQHDPPAWMRELVILRDRHCVHPHCQTDARACDLDHIIEYLDLALGGPPGQTHPGNLAPLCRRHHRAKTRRRWRYQRDPDGSYLWTGPHGRQYRVTPDGPEALPPA